MFDFQLLHYRLRPHEEAEEHEFGFPHAKGLEGIKSVVVETRKAARLAGIVSCRCHLRVVCCPLLLVPEIFSIACNCVHELSV